MFCPRLQPLSSRLSSFRRHPAQQHRSPAAKLLSNFPRITIPGRKLPIGLAPGRASPIFSVSGQAFPTFFVSGQAFPIFFVSGQAFPTFFVSGQAFPIFFVSGQAFPIFFLAGRFPRFLGRTRKSTLAATPRRRSQRNRRSHHPLHFLPHRNQPQHPLPCHPPRNLRVIILSHLTIKTAPRHFRIARRLSLKIQDRSATLAGYQQCTSHSQLIQSHKVVRGASVSG